MSSDFRLRGVGNIWNSKPPVFLFFLIHKSASYFFHDASDGVEQVWINWCCAT